MLAFLLLAIIISVLMHCVIIYLQSRDAGKTSTKVYTQNVDLEALSSSIARKEGVAGDEAQKKIHGIIDDASEKGMKIKNLSEKLENLNDEQKRLREWLADGREAASKQKEDLARTISEKDLALRDAEKAKDSAGLELEELKKKLDYQNDAAKAEAIEVKNLRKQLNGAEEEARGMEDKMGARIEESKTQDKKIEGLQAQMKEMKGALESFEGQNKEAKISREDWVKQNEELQRAIKEKNLALQATQSSSYRSREEIEAMRREIELKKTRAQEHTQGFETRSRRLTETRYGADALKTSMSGKCEEASRHDRKIEDLQARMRDLRREQDRYETQKDGSGIYRDDVLRHKDELARSIEELDFALRDAHRVRDQAKLEFEDIRRNFNRHDTAALVEAREVEDLREQLDEAKAETRLLESRLHSRMKEIDKQDNEIDDLQGQIEDLHAEHRVLERRNEGSSEDVMRRKGELVRALRELDLALEQAQNARDLARLDLEEMKKELARQQMSNQDKSQYVQEISEQLIKAQDEAETLRAILDEKFEASVMHDKDVERLQGQVQGLKGEHQSVEMHEEELTDIEAEFLSAQKTLEKQSVLSESLKQLMAENISKMQQLDTKQKENMDLIGRL